MHGRFGNPWNGHIRHIGRVAGLFALVLAMSVGHVQAQSTARVELSALITHANTENLVDVVTGGDSFMITAVLNQPAPVGGVTVRINKPVRDDGPIATFEQRATIPAGEDRTTFTVTTLPTTQEIAQQVAGRVEGGNVTKTSVIFVKPRAANDPRGSAVLYEAEAGKLVRARVVADDSVDFTGTGEVTFIRAKGYVDLTITADQAGPHTLAFRYRINQGLSDRQMQIIVNGTAQTVTFTGTRGPHWHEQVGVTMPLQQGMNTVRVLAPSKDAIILDHVTVARQ